MPSIEIRVLGSTGIEDHHAHLLRLDPAIRRAFADVAVAVMDMYYAKYEALRASRATHAAMAEYWNRARALVSWVGVVELGADVNAKLVRLEALMSNN